jgi:hypothetical protein
MEPRDHQITFRVPTRIRLALEEKAALERRTVADVLNLMLEDVFPAREGKATMRFVNDPNATSKHGGEGAKIVRNPSAVSKHGSDTVKIFPPKGRK